MISVISLKECFFSEVNRLLVLNPSYCTKLYRFLCCDAFRFVCGGVRLKEGLKIQLLEMNETRVFTKSTCDTLLLFQTGSSIVPSTDRLAVIRNYQGIQGVGSLSFESTY